MIERLARWVESSKPLWATAFLVVAFGCYCLGMLFVWSTR